MKRIWDVDELAEPEHWSLKFEETRLLKTKPAETTCHLLFSLSFIRTPGASLRQSMSSRKRHSTI